MLIDSHTHLFDAQFDHDRHEVIQHALDAGVDAMVVPATNYATSMQAIELCEQYDEIYACVGIHPHEASKTEKDDLQKIHDLLDHPKVVAIGETGLDYFYDFAPKDLQRDIFMEQLRMAANAQKPIVVHTRDSLPDAIAMVTSREYKGNSVTVEEARSPVDARRAGVFHCFTGSNEDAKLLARHGFFVSYPGIVTFKKSPVVEYVKAIGYESILVETDAPYLAPVPMRGKRNEPAFITYTIEHLAKLFEVDNATIIQSTGRNACHLFGISSHV